MKFTKQQNPHEIFQNKKKKHIKSVAHITRMKNNAIIKMSFPHDTNQKVRKKTLTNYKEQ